MTAIQQAMIGSTKRPIEFIAGINGSTLGTGVTSIVFTGHQVGDLLLGIGGSQQTADPTFTAGWTKIGSFNNNNTNLRMGIFVYKFATTTANETLTFTGTGTSSIQYSTGYIFRNVRAIGNFGAANTSSSTAISTVTSPSLTLSDTTNVRSALVLGTHAAVISTVPNSMTVANGAAYGLDRSSWAGGTFTVSTAVYSCCGIVELLF